VFVALRQYGFIVLYALLLTGVGDYLIFPPTVLFRRILLP